MTELEQVTLEYPSSSTFVYVPNAGMIGTSLSTGRDEFLGPRRGLDTCLTTTYAAGIPIGSVGGIPLQPIASPTDSLRSGGYRSAPSGAPTTAQSSATIS